MKNITVSVGDEVYHRARTWAAERRTSDELLTEDLSAGQVFDGVTVVNPFDGR